MRITATEIKPDITQAKNSVSTSLMTDFVEKHY
jgi:hypothetical protein